MAERQAIGKKLRFEVFKRDKFTCQYCGRKAPDVVLEVDHIVPVAKGGTNEIMNLVTSCWDCNRGKGKRELNDDSVVVMNRENFEMMEAKQEQVEMLFSRRKELNEYDSFILAEMADAFTETVGNAPDSMEMASLKRYIKKYPLDEILEALDISCGKYRRNQIVEKMGAILYNWHNPQQAAKKMIFSALHINRIDILDTGLTLEELVELINENVNDRYDLERLRKKLYKQKGPEFLIQIFDEMYFEKEGWK